MEEQKVPNLLESYGLEVNAGNVEVGKTYPIFAMITRIIDETPGALEVELNFSINAKMNVPDDTKIELLKERAFEPGIFVAKVLSNEAAIEVDCQTVIFGKKSVANV